jgi:hypothetical protein
LETIGKRAPIDDTEGILYAIIAAATARWELWRWLCQSKGSDGEGQKIGQLHSGVFERLKRGWLMSPMKAGLID